MKFKTFKQSIIALALLSSSIAAFAVSCPSAESVRQSVDKLDSVTVFDLNNAKFAVWGFEPILDGEKYWHLAAFVNTEDLNIALIAGQDAIRNITKQKGSGQVNESDDAFMCGYETTSSNAIVGVISLKFENEMHNRKLKIGSFNIPIKSLKF